MLDLFVLFSACSDSLVEQVTGSEYDAKYIKERDEEGFHESEVTVSLELYCVNCIFFSMSIMGIKIGYLYWYVWVKVKLLFGLYLMGHGVLFWHSVG